MLANAGVLPMFGFPTRVRPLYKEPLRRASGREYAEVADRPLEFAISHYAPGSEVVNENQLHVCTGFVAYEIRGDQAVPVDNPLGEPINIHQCRECEAVYAQETLETSRPVCRRRAVLKMFQPRGFRNDYKPKESRVRGQFSRRVRQACLARRRPVLRCTVKMPNANVRTINDNDGDLYQRCAVGKDLSPQGLYHPGRKTSQSCRVRRGGLSSRIDVMAGCRHTTLIPPAITTRHDCALPSRRVLGEVRLGAAP